MRSYLLITITAFCILESCSSARHTGKKETEPVKTSKPINGHKSSINVPARTINTKNVNPEVVVEFAESLVGIKYKYGSAIKEQGFDCSGFITYVFKHFDIAVPRSSVDFTNAGTTVSLEACKRGDLILFTGSDTTGWIVGHMGIITENIKGKVRFIHSASGNGKGVMISEMSNYFSTRFAKVIRIFK